MTLGIVLVVGLALFAVGLAVYFSRSDYTAERDHLAKVQERRNRADQRAIEWEQRRQRGTARRDLRAEQREVAEKARYKAQADKLDAERSEKVVDRKRGKAANRRIRRS